MQSNISAHVARLERELGSPLVDRADGRLTEEGTVVVARARRILSELDALVADVAACKDEVTGTVRVGMIGTTARWLVPRLMDMARQRHPKLRLVVVEGIGTSLEPQLASGQLDLAVLNLPLSGRDLVSRLLFEEDLMLMVPEGHAMANPDHPLSLEDLADMELILPLPGTAFRDELDAVTRPLGITLLPAAEIDGLRLIASLTFEGYGPAILPATAIPSYLRSQFHPSPSTGSPVDAWGWPSAAAAFPRPPPGHSANSSGRWWPSPAIGRTACTSTPELRSRGLLLGDPGLPPHAPHGRAPHLGVKLLHHLEAEPGVERHVPLLRGFEIRRHAIRVGQGEYWLEEGGAHSLALTFGHRAQGGQVPVGFFGMETVDLEQQSQGAAQRGRSAGMGRWAAVGAVRPVRCGGDRGFPTPRFRPGPRSCRRGHREGTGA